MLNAFRHQRTRNPARSRPAVAVPCAQRLSASTNEEPELARPKNMPYKCSTPFGINERGTCRKRQRIDRLAEWCSTPFGINERGTRRRRRTQSRVDGCSTPFGINERGTQTISVLFQHRDGAQRLSASTNEEHRLPAWPIARQRVLNAFRHQRTRNTRHDCGRHAVACAQRLSASTNEELDFSTNSVRSAFSCSTPFGINERGTRFAVLSCSLCRSCAQRLSASTNEELDPIARARNAYRVLNAFRHQRTRNSRVCQSWATITGCSTPFGINERGTRAERPAGPARRVLNAFRHQRTRNVLHEEARHLRHDVLNAFRHQRTRNVFGSPQWRALSACAQRLSASTNEERR